MVAHLLLVVVDAVVPPLQGHDLVVCVPVLTQMLAVGVVGACCYGDGASLEWKSSCVRGFRE